MSDVEVADHPTDDRTAERLIAFLCEAGADAHPHAAGRSLLDHLVGTYEITRRWGQPTWLQHAALIHSVSGTEAHRQRLLEPDRRTELRALAGERAERLAHLFALTPRRLLFAGTHRWARGLPGRSDDGAPDDRPATRQELDALVVLHLANLAEQARAPDSSPGRWLVRLHELAEHVFDSDAVTLPWFVAQLATVSAADEAAAGEAYRDALAQTDPQVHGERLALAATRCPVVAEPCVWLAHAAWRNGERPGVHEWGELARRRLTGLGTAWDKRLGYEEWLGVIDGMASAPPAVDARPPTTPRELYAVVLGARPQAPRGRRPASGPRPAADRFARYMRRLADATSPDPRLLYPGLDRRPWWDPDDFPLVAELRANAPQIRAELLALDPSSFAAESEPIARTGEWDVVFFHERGRRHPAVHAACPITARAIERGGAMLTAAGLSYVSRMRPGTHIAAHRGPTNLRLRCHLGIVVPDGDCAIRVDRESRGWSEGDCLVFDDSFEHEAWNHTDGDRIVLIVDLWHPGLSDTEVHLLAGLHRYAAGYARRLERYWAINAAARGEAPAA